MKHIKLIKIGKSILELREEKEELKISGYYTGKNRELRKLNVKIRNLIKRQQYLTAG